MSTSGTVVLEALPTGPPQLLAPHRRCPTPVAEAARLQWWTGDPGDPAELLEHFLTGHGLPVGDLSHPDPRRPHPATGVCGAAVFVSAAAGAALAGAPAGPSSPVPAVPDLVAVVYTHAVRPTHGPAPTSAVRPVTGRPTGADRGPAAPWRVGRWRPSWSRREHAQAVVGARAAIAAGDIYQVNLVGHAAAPYRGDPVPALARLAALPGARYGGLLTGAGWAIGCASPETLITAAGGRLLTRPIKGTRPATAAGRRELLTSAKERAEHVMIVDLERNDLARVARTGSVRVDELYALRRWCDLWQAESTVSAAAAPGLGLAALLRAVCPGGSVTGAPKLSALARIAELEPVGRGAAMGALGWVDPHGGVDLGLTIRTVAADPHRLHLWAGGGITWGSDPAAEVAEAAAKAAPLRAALTGPAPRPADPTVTGTGER